MAVAAGRVVDPGRGGGRRWRRRAAGLPEGHAAEVPELPAAGVGGGGVPVVAGDRHGRGSYYYQLPRACSTEDVVGLHSASVLPLSLSLSLLK